jgi:hypothetical protein
VLVDFLCLGNRLSRLMNDGLGSGQLAAARSWVPPVDMFEEPDAIRIMA